MITFVAHRNGRPATAEQLAPLAFAGFAHFTAAQVTEGRIRGLDLHLERLRFASTELFGTALPEDRIRSFLRTALETGDTDMSVTATVYPDPESDSELSVLVRTRPAATPPQGPLALATVEYERVLPAVKHVGELAKSYYPRLAEDQGFDDVAFVDRRGRLGEASIWNLAFWDGAAVVWPKAKVLRGVTMGIIRRRLDALGVPQRFEELRLDDLPSMAGGAVMNSWTPGIAVSRLGLTSIPVSPDFTSLLHRAYEAEPPVAP